jgi:hypothetical protein
MSKSWFDVPATTSGRILKSSVIHPSWWNGASEKSRRKAFVGVHIMLASVLVQMWLNNKLQNDLTESNLTVDDLQYKLDILNRENRRMTDHMYEAGVYPKK